MQTITYFGTVSNSATSRTSTTERKDTAFGVSIISDRNLRATGSSGCSEDRNGDIGSVSTSNTEASPQGWLHFPPCNGHQSSSLRI